MNSSSKRGLSPRSSMGAYGSGAGGPTPTVDCAVPGAMCGGGGVWVDQAVEEGWLAGGSEGGGYVAAAGG